MLTRFEWGGAKADSNLRKHGVAFEDAIFAFADPFALMAQHRVEGAELRWQTLGSAGACVVLLVAHTVGQDDDGTEVIRVISARAANRRERTRYEDQNR